MSKERFEIFGKIIKDNEEVPNLLDNYLATVRLDEFNEKIKDLQSQLDQANERLKGAIVPPVKIGDTIYVVPSETNYEINIINRHSELNKVYEYIVSEIRYNKYGYSVVCELDNIPFYFNYEKAKKWCCEHFDTEKFYGETWFTTRAEAQAKLQELQNGDFSGE